MRPDIVFVSSRLAVFVDGCFWHRCPEHATQPKANKQWWTNKLQDNVERDRRHDSALRKAGWSVLRVWEHEDPHEAAAKISLLIRGSRTEVPVKGG